MSARAIVSASLHKAADLRTSENGNPFATFTIGESLSNGATRWWQAIAFSESVIEILKELAIGEPIAVAGEFDCELYAPPGGESRLSWKITADSVLSAHAKRKPRTERSPGVATPARQTGRMVAAASWAAPTRGGAHDGDDIPF
jgi:Single-strand binding protein family